jgi:hypothetical protein
MLPLQWRGDPSAPPKRPQNFNLRHDIAMGYLSPRHSNKIALVGERQKVSAANGRSCLQQIDARRGRRLMV